MRIIAGTKKGMNLLSPKSMVSRPITDMVKESLFNVLIKYGIPEDKRIADLFAGVGSIGLEALSRGAEFTAFVEKDPKIFSILKKNIKKTGFQKKSKAVRANAFNIGAPLDLEGKLYDCIFVDPPFPVIKGTGPKSRLAKLMSVLAEQVKPQGLVIIRTHKEIDMPENFNDFIKLDSRNWGINSVNIFRLEKK